jgi:hypothetical protein
MSECLAWNQLVHTWVDPVFGVACLTVFGYLIYRLGRWTCRQEKP